MFVRHELPFLQGVILFLNINLGEDKMSPRLDSIFVSEVFLEIKNLLEDRKGDKMSLNIVKVLSYQTSANI